jgi:hypothetical protein
MDTIRPSDARPGGCELMDGMHTAAMGRRCGRDEGRRRGRMMRQLHFNRQSQPSPANFWLTNAETAS